MNNNKSKNKKAPAPNRTTAQREASGAAAYRAWRDKVRASPHYAQLAAEADGELEVSMQLAAARLRAHISQVELAKRLGISQAQVSRLEKPGYISYELSTIQRYVAALGTGYKVRVIIEEPDNQDKGAYAQ